MPQKSKPRTRKPAPPPVKPIRREVGAAVCFFLAVFAVLSIYTTTDALFINLFRALAKGLLGFGCYWLPPLLLAAAVMLLFHRGRPVRLRVTAVLLLAVLIGSISELMHPAEYGEGFGLIRGLWLREGASGGGVMGGLMTLGFAAIFSSIGAGIILFAGTGMLLFASFKNQILWLYKLISDSVTRERPAYEPEPEPETKLGPVSVQPERVKKPFVDIQADGAEPVREKRGLFGAKRVKSPDEVLREPTEPAPVEDTSTETEPEDIDLSDTETAEVVIPVDEAEDFGRLPKEVPMPTLTDDAAEDEAALSVSAPEAPAKPRRVSKKTDDDKPVVDIADVKPARVVGSYAFPPTDLLDAGKPAVAADVSTELKVNATRLSETLASFSIDAKIINITRGPSVTRYEVELDAGIKLTKLTNLSDDIALSLGATGVRIAPIPDKVAIVGIEVPNKIISIVYAREIIESREFAASKSKISFAVGRDISGDSIVGDITRLPHLLIAGTTGSGKSVCMNSLIISMLYKSSPDEVRFIMIDPKMVELNVYNGIPHLLIPVVTDPKKASGALQWAVGEMMRRYAMFRDAGVRDFFEYNTYAERAGNDKIPQMVIMVDELADLMLVVAKEVEESICRIAQMGRAAGVHLVIATQSPRADVITGLMKANIPSRIAFAVASGLESRIIMDTTGADKLVGRGDMLYFPLGSRKPARVQGCFISSAEVEKVVRFVKNYGRTDYSEEVLQSIERSLIENQKGGEGISDDGADGFDNMLPQAVEVILETGQASTSMLQRRLKLGYARAARLVDQLERRGIVGPLEGAKPRQLLISRENWEEMKLQNPEYRNFEG